MEAEETSFNILLLVCFQSLCFYIQSWKQRKLGSTFCIVLSVSLYFHTQQIKYRKQDSTFCSLVCFYCIFKHHNGIRTQTKWDLTFCTLVCLQCFTVFSNTTMKVEETRFCVLYFSVLSLYFYRQQWKYLRKQDLTFCSLVCFQSLYFHIQWWKWEKLDSAFCSLLLFSGLWLFKF